MGGLDGFGVEAFAGPEGDVDESDEDGYFDERADHAGEGFAGGDPEHADGDGDGEFEVVGGGGERDAWCSSRSDSSSRKPSRTTLTHIRAK